MSKIVMDLDGVTADFVWAFTSLINRAYPEVEPRRTKEHTSGWAFDDIPAEAKKKAWKVIMGSKTWWQTLPPMGKMSDFNMLDALNRQHDMYFITAREGTGVKLQSEKWLRTQGIQRPSVVVIASGKPKGKIPVIEAINPDIIVDDHGGLMTALAQVLPKPIPMLILQNQLYNRDTNMERIGYRATDLTDTISAIQQVIKKGGAQ